MPWFSKRSGDEPSDETPTRRGGGRLALVVLEGADPGAELRLAPFDAELGRGDETRARGDRLTLRDRSVSGRQARILPGADGWTLEHVPSAGNPTLVNGQRVERKLLAVGDRIGIGNVVLEVRALVVPEAKTEIVRLQPPGVETTTIMRLGADVWGHLELVRGPIRLQGTRFPLASERIRIGRQPDCDVVLVDPDVSRLHAELVRVSERVVLHHRSRTNPTSRNGVRLMGETELAHGDEIGLAESVALRLVLANAPEITAPPSGSLRRVMEARVDLEAQLERDFVRDGSFLDVDIADSYGLKSSEPRPERVFVSFERFRGYVGERVGEHSGRILNSNGDEVMAFFESADHAVRCARALLMGLPAWNSRENLLQREFRVRIGIHTGRSAVDLHHGVAYSPVLDVAGHLQKTAPIGGVLISEATRAALADEAKGFAPGAKLARENLDTWVLAPEALA